MLNFLCTPVSSLCGESIISYLVLLIYPYFSKKRCTFTPPSSIGQPRFPLDPHSIPGIIFWRRAPLGHHKFFRACFKAAFQRILRAFSLHDTKNPLKPFGFKGFLAQRVGFEPTCGCPQTDFERNKRDTQAAYILIIGFKNAQNRHK